MNDTFTVRPSYKPENAKVSLTVISSDPKIAEGHPAGNGDSWNIVGISPGTCDITVTTQNGLTATAHVTVVDTIAPEKLSYDHPITIVVDERRYIDPIVTPSNAMTMFSIKSDNPDVVTVFTGGGGRTVETENGQEYFGSSVGVTGVSVGTALITVRAVNGVQTTVSVFTA